MVSALLGKLEGAEPLNIREDKKMRSLFLLILVVIIYYFLKSVFTSSRRRRAAGSRPGVQEKVDDMVKDPSCETYIPKSTALTMVMGGKRYFFCSEECLESFKKKNIV